MKILAIVGSPRKGNTYKVIQQIETTIKGCDPDVDFSYLFLKEANLEMCRGCFLCITRGEKFCPIKDDFNKIQEEMLTADGVILASPVYCFNVSSLIKNFIDRMSYVCHRPHYFGKYALAVTTSSGGGIPDVLKYLESMASVWGFTLVDKLGLMNHPAIPASAKTTAKIEKTALKFYTAIKTKITSPPRFNSLMQFRIMKLNSLESKEHFPADFVYYKDKKDYFTETKVGVIKNTAAKIMEKAFVLMMNRMTS